MTIDQIKANAAAMPAFAAWIAAVEKTQQAKGARNLRRALTEEMKRLEELRDFVCATLPPSP
jgi:hypothetical protein